MDNNYPRQSENAGNEMVRFTDNPTLQAFAQRHQELQRIKARLREEESKLAADVQHTFKRGLEKRIQEGQAAQ